MKNLFSEEMLIIIALVFITIMAVGFTGTTIWGMYEIIKTLSTMGGLI